MTETRKRLRSEEDSFSLQTKCFVNQQMIEKSDKQLMKKIYEKTLSKIFAGAKIQSQNMQSKANNNSITNDTSMILDTVDDKLHDRQDHGQDCMLCWKDVETSTHFLCKNCNLKVCDSCHQKCFECKTANLCSNCVNIFGCLIAGNPVCEDCKMFVD